MYVWIPQKLVMDPLGSVEHTSGTTVPQLYMPWIKAIDDDNDMTMMMMTTMMTT